ncbi:uncharacterized protein LOC117648161 [Thrips palmi]|uniref:Uncharacterized protein LOC117648161 n=1 Tax=Thrips palmi TaxID=161013 RepID=A0A6P8ZCF4_THRPL|nr:uncharacterized protein LOC117648161 [Thrips palmi]
MAGPAEGIRQGAYFSSYAEFKEALDIYNREKNVLFTTASSKAVAIANNNLKAGEEPYAEALKYKNLTLTCKSGGYYRPSSSKGLRPHQRTMKIGCPAQITLKAVRHPTQRLQITILREKHSHLQTEDFAAFYPENRRVDAETETTVDNMILCGAKPMHIRSHVRSTTRKKMTPKDFSNLQQKIKKKNRKGKTDEEDLLAELNHLLEEDPGSFYKIGYVDEGESEEEEEDGDEAEKPRPIDFIIFQTSEMRENLRRFPDIVGMDTTYDTNKHNMHLVVMQVVDNHGNGRIVAYVLVRRETKDIIEASIATFAKANEDVMPHVKTVLVDKDYKEIGGIKKVLPHVHVHLCHTHVLRIFERKTKKEDNGPEIFKIVKQMSVCQSKEEFLELYSKLQTVASENFMTQYFDKFWKDIDSAWILYVRNASLSLGIRSNQHVESHNGKIKSVINRTQTVADLIRQLLRLHKSREFDSAYKDFREMASKAYIAHNRDPDVQLILDSLSDWGGRLLVSELKKSASPDYVQGPDIVTEDENLCSCNFYKMFGMKHCAHIFFQRRNSGHELFVVADVPLRWLKTDNRNQDPDEDESPVRELQNGGQVRVSMRRHPLGPRPMDKAAKYKKALEVCTEISSLLSLTGGQQFEQRMEALENILKLWMSKRECIVLPISANGVIDMEFIQNSETHNVEPTASDRTTEEVHISSNTETSGTHNLRDDLGAQKCPPDIYMVTCKNCEVAIPRKIVKKQGSRNYKRFYYVCRCHPTAPFYRWEKCFHCNAVDVREGHYQEDAIPHSQNGPGENTSSPNIFGNRSPLNNSANSGGEIGPSNNDQEKTLAELVSDYEIKSRASSARMQPPGSPDMFGPSDPESDGSFHMSSRRSPELHETHSHISDSPTENIPGNSSPDENVSLSLPSCDEFVFTTNSANNDPEYVLIQKQISEGKTLSQLLADFDRRNPPKRNDQRGQETATDESDGSPIHTSIRRSQELTSPTNTVSEPDEDSDGLSIHTSLRRSQELTSPTNTVVQPDEDSDGLSIHTSLRRSQELTSPTNSVHDQDLDGLSIHSPSRRSQELTSPTNSGANKEQEPGSEKNSGGSIHKFKRNPQGMTPSTNSAANKILQHQPSFALPQTNQGPLKPLDKSAQEARRKKGKEIPDANVKEHSHNSWIVVSSTDQDQSYKVIEKQQLCKISACAEPPCSHMFSCSCQDFRYRKAPCKHIYKIYEVVKQNEENNANSRRIVIRDVSKLSSLVLPSHNVSGNPRIKKPEKKGGSTRQPRLLNECGACNKIIQQGALISTCSLCKKVVHQDTECSIPSVSGVMVDEDVRVCRRCLCERCKKPKTKNHLCQCHTCHRAIRDSDDSSECNNCRQYSHNRCISHKNAFCDPCNYIRVTGWGRNDTRLLLNGAMLTDVHIIAAIRMLQDQFPDVDGLQPPIAQEKDITTNVIQYPKRRPGSDYVQIISNGHMHWLTCIILKGPHGKATVLDTLNNFSLSSFAEQQVALMMHTDHTEFKVYFPHCQDQGATMDCGPLAIALSTEFCFTREIKETTFDTDRLRPHFLQCMQRGRMERFPQRGEPPKLKKGSSSKWSFVKVYCKCRLPDHFDKMLVKCSTCRMYYHMKCEGLTKNPSKRHWSCSKCC